MVGADCDFVVEELGRLEIISGLILPHQELRFLKKFMCCLTKCGEASKNDKLTSATSSFEAVLKQIKGDDLAPILLLKFKAEVSKMCAVLLDSFKFMSCSSDELLEFVDCVVGNVKDLATLEADASVKNQIMVLDGKLSFLRNFVDYSAKRCTEHPKLAVLLDLVKVYTQDAACLSLLCLLGGEDESMAETFETMLSNLLQKIKPCTPEVIGMFFGILEVSKSSRSDKHLVGEIVAGLADFLLDDFVDPLKDCVHFLKEGLIFMITFSMDPAEEAEANAGDGILSQISQGVQEVQSLISSLYMDPSKVEIPSVLSMIAEIKVEVRNVFVQVPNPSEFNFSRTNGMGFVDFFLENLMEMQKRNPRRIAFARGQVMVVQEELLYLKPFLKDIMELQKEEEDLNNLWKRIINTVFLAEHATASCLITDHPIWYDLLHLSSVIQEIKLIQVEVKTHMSSSYELHSKMASFSHSVVKQANPSRLQETVVGWKDESVAIMDKLTRGTTRLEIVSIVGMPGLGKTTLAKKVYSDSSAIYHFNRRAWCCVSQMYKPRDLYLDILSDVTGADARQSDSGSSDDDLAEKLRKSLKGRRYLIVLDDIWNVEAWESIKGSFPDDNKGSRIMFTSRIHNLVSQVKHSCSPHPLRPLSDEESWELLQDKLFQKDSCPPDDLARIGMNIARNCKGLPLAVVLIAGILAGKGIDFWKKIEERTTSQVVSEGCMDVLELSYKNLPENLKPCFLYFGAFPEDRIVGARKLMSLWIAEGLVPKVKGRSQYEVAEAYLSDLIDRSLIILAARSSNGGIKACRIHDLLRDLCLVKIQEDNFLKCVHDKGVSNDQGSFDNIRLCIHAEWPKFVDTKPAGSFVHSLILLGKYPGSKKFPCPSALFNSFKLLNVLDLEGILIGGPFPEEVTLMVHLRYLAISCGATEIPDSIVNLWNLETFILIASVAEIHLPRTIWQMKSLRHLHMPSLWLTGLAGHDQYFQLEHLDIFSVPHLDSGNDTKELLRRLPRLRKLNCIFLERHSGGKPYKFPELSCLTDLESLKVISYGIVFFGEKCNQFPAFDFPSSLRKLTLGRFSLPWTAISVIGQLPNLEVLKLRARAFSGKIWKVEEGEFLNLKWLELWQIEFEEWSVPDEAFQSLERLIVKHCYSLEGIPPSLGYIPTLKKIEMHWCFKASASARQILQEQRDMANELLEVIVFD